MSSWQRREQRKREFEEQCVAREAEERRVAALPIYDRIEEIQDIHDVKVFLHWLAGKLDLE